MSRPVTIENDAFTMEVYPQYGGKVASLVDKADNFELMFDYPAELPTGPVYDSRYDSSWCAGWDECFPAVAPGKYPGHPYDGISIPDHGELWGLPTTAVPTRNGITTVWHGLRFGYRLTRKLWLEDFSVVASYTLMNLSPFEFRFIWGMHPNLSMIAPVNIEHEAGGEFRFSHDEKGVDHQKLFHWPVIEPGLDLSALESLPARLGWKVFSMDPISTPIKLRYPTRGRSMLIEFSSEDDMAAYWGVWINTGGWGGNRHVAIEPTTGRYDQLDRAVADGSAARVPALGRRDWSVRWTVGAQ